MKVLLVFLLLVAPAYGATLEEIEAQYQAQMDSIRVAENAAGALVTKARVDSIVAADSLLAPGLNGVTIVADTKDAVWVQIDVPLSASTGIAKSYWLGVIERFKSHHRAQDAGVVGRVRLSRGSALSALRELDANLKAGQ